MQIKNKTLQQQSLLSQLKSLPRFAYSYTASHIFTLVLRAMGSSRTSRGEAADAHERAFLPLFTLTHLGSQLRCVNGGVR